MIHTIDDQINYIIFLTHLLVLSTNVWSETECYRHTVSLIVL